MGDSGTVRIPFLRLAPPPLPLLTIPTPEQGVLGQLRLFQLSTRVRRTPLYESLNLPLRGLARALLLRLVTESSHAEDIDR